VNQTEQATSVAEHAGRETGPDAARLEELRPRVHAWVQPDGSWFISNAGAVIGEEGVLVIDTCATAERTRRTRSCQTPG
jgi:cyclase